MNQRVAVNSSAAVASLVISAGECASICVLEFFWAAKKAAAIATMPRRARRSSTIAGVMR
jgi:hypothetical protein